MISPITGCAVESESSELLGAWDGIGTQEHLRDWTQNLAPLTWQPLQKRQPISCTCHIRSPARPRSGFATIAFFLADLIRPGLHTPPLQLRQQFLHEHAPPGHARVFALPHPSACVAAARRLHAATGAARQAHDAQLRTLASQHL